MKEYADGVCCSGNGETGADSRDGANVHSSGGTFVLRRARYFSQSGAPQLNAEQPHALTNLVEAVDQGTRHSMVVQNLRVVVSIARRYLNRGLEFVDLVRVGNRGLIQALEKFEPEAGFCFTTYVTWCVSREIELAIMQHNGPLSCETNSLVSFGDAASKHAKTCPAYPAGCLRKPA